MGTVHIYNISAYFWNARLYISTADVIYVFSCCMTSSQFRVGHALEKYIIFIRKQLVFYTVEYFIILFEFISLED